MDVALPKSLQRTLDQAEENLSMIERKWRDMQESNNTMTSSDSSDPIVNSRNDSVRALAIGVLLLTRKRLKGEETEEIESSVEKCKAGLLKMHNSSTSSGKSSDNKKSVDKKPSPLPKPNKQSSSSNNNNNNNNSSSKKKKKQKTKA